MENSNILLTNSCWSCFNCLTECTVSLYQVALLKEGLMHLKHPMWSFYGLLTIWIFFFSFFLLVNLPKNVVVSNVLSYVDRLRERHLNSLRPFWTRLKTSRRLASNLCPQWWILFSVTMQGICLMQENQKFFHFLQQL